MGGPDRSVPTEFILLLSIYSLIHLLWNPILKCRFFPRWSPGSGGGIYPPPLCDIPLGCCFFTGPWTVTRSSLRMLRRVAAFCRPLRPVLSLVSFPRSRSPVVGVLGLPFNEFHVFTAGRPF